jgi:mitochondrial fission protein ELM1
LKALILHDAAKVGALNQCIGLAEALGCASIHILPITIRFLWRFVPQCLWPHSFRLLLVNCHSLFPHCHSSVGGNPDRSKASNDCIKGLDCSDPNLSPDLILVSGRKALVPAVMLKKMYPKAKLIVLQKPGAFRAQADGIILPAHDGVEADEKTFVICGNTHRVTPNRLLQEKEKFPDLCHQVLGYQVVTILIGGPNKAFRFSVKSILKQWERLLSNLSQDPSLFYLVSLSRRTPTALADLFSHIKHPRINVWKGEGPNPYLAFLGLADAFVITADSVAMTSEAAATGEPIHILPLPGRNAKFKRYHQALQAHGATKVYTGHLETWGYAPLRETERAAQWIKGLLKI